MNTDNPENKNKNKDPNDTEERTAKSELTYKQTTLVLSVLLILLLTVFLSMRFFDKNAKEEFPSFAEIERSNDDTQNATNNSEDANALVNINTANKEELMALPSIGEKKAQAILDYRQEYGMFVTKDDIMKVSGIGEKLFENIKDLITTE